MQVFAKSFYWTIYVHLKFSQLFLSLPSILRLSWCDLPWKWPPVISVSWYSSFCATTCSIMLWVDCVTNRIQQGWCYDTLRLLWKNQHFHLGPSPPSPLHHLPWRGLGSENLSLLLTILCVNSPVEPPAQPSLRLASTSGEPWARTTRLSGFLSVRHGGKWCWLF